MKHVEIATQDYAANHAKAIVDLKAQAKAVRKDDAEAADALDADAAYLEAKPVPTVVRYENITLKHRLRNGTVHEFTASFDEVQRILSCPDCGVEVFIPEEYRGMP